MSCRVWASAGIGRAATVWSLSVVMVAVLVVVTAPPSRASSSPQGVVVSDDPVDYTPHVLDGYVTSIAEVGDRVIVGGTFSQVKEAGDPTVHTRNYLFAFDKTTGALDPNFVPVVDNIVNVVKPAGDGTSVFVGGKFANVNGVPNFGLAKLDVATGQQVPGFSATTAGAVRDLAVRNGKVYIGGDIWSVNGVPKNRLAAIDAITGAVDSTFNVGTTLPRTSVDWVAKLDVSPLGDEMVIIGNFLEVDGLPREQIAVIDLSGPQATVMDWATDGFAAGCSANFWTYMRDVEYSPDGAYFAVVTTGGPFFGTLCDTATRWETGVTGTDIQETWSDWSGGDTLTAVAITDVAVYIGGHQRWMNNHAGRDYADVGAVSREGIAALDPINGVPYTWNPGKDRGVAVYDLHASPDMLYVGSDTDFTAGEYHAKLAAFSTAGGTTVPVPTPASLPSDLHVGHASGTLDARPYDGSTFGSAVGVTSPIDWSQTGGAFYQAGKLYYLDGSVVTSRTYDGASWGPPVVEPVWLELTSSAGLGWLDGRMYYAESGELYYHYLSLESGILGSQRLNATSGYDWTGVTGLAFADGDLYFASTDGNLRRATMNGVAPDITSITIVSGPGAGDGLDWSDVNSLFFLSFDLGPDVSITAPADGSVVSGVVPVTATATDDEGVAQVEFFAGGSSLGVDTDGTDGWSTSWDSTLGPDGSVTLDAVATDTGGNTNSASVTVTVDNQGPTVTILSPSDGATVSGTISVSADAVDAVGVASVEFFVDGTSIGTDADGTDGWSVAWATASSPDGPATVSATATDTGGATDSDSVAVTVDNSGAGVVLFVVGSTTLGNGDTAVKDRLEASGYAVTVIDDDVATAADATGASFVIIGSTVNSNLVGATFRDIAQPVWDAKPWHFDDMGMTGTVGGTDYGSVSTATVDIVDATHPMAAGLSGTVTFTTASRSASWGVPAASADVVAEIAGMPTMFVYEAGDTLADGGTAAGCRLTFPLFFSAPASFTDDGWAMFDATAGFAAGGCVTVPANPGPDVAITNPLDGAVLTGLVTVDVTATDDDGVAQVEVLVDGVSVGVDSDGTDGWSVPWDTTATGDGSAVDVTAVATDGLGSTGSAGVTVVVDNFGPTVTITAPAEGAVVQGIVSIGADAVDAVGVAQVEFFVDGSSVGVDTDGSDGWSATWDASAATGPAVISATATDTGGATGSDSVNVTVDNSSAGIVLFVVADPASLTTGDAAVFDRLQAGGYVVNLADDGTVTAGDATGADLVIIASSVNSNAVGTIFNASAVPVWDAKPWHFDDLGMTGGSANTDFGTERTTTIDIVDDAHPMAAGLTGTVTFTNGTRSVSWGVPGSGANVVASVAGMPTIFEYPAGATLADGSTAPACRMSFPIFTRGPTSFTTDAWTLFDAAVAHGTAGCPAGTPPPAPAGPTAIVISVDGLRKDSVASLGATELPNIYRFIGEGTSTDNARTMVDSTNTLPNHLSMVTGRPVGGADGHGVTFNEDDGLTVHDAAGFYVAGMFDVAHDNGLGTLLYASKPKFDFLDRSWDAVNGALDVTGVDDGTDKIDFYMRSDGATITNAFLTQMGVDPVEMSMIHYGIPDDTAHDFGFESPEYEQALRDVDAWIGQIVSFVENDPALAGVTTIILTTDHGGSGFDHNDTAAAINYTIPFYVWGGGVSAGSDVYVETGATRLDPGTLQPPVSDPVQPVRNGDVANLALEAVGLGPTPGSVFNAAQDLNLLP